MGKHPPREALPSRRMPERIVISFRAVANVEDDGGQRYLERAIAIKQRCERSGATLCAWSAQTFSVDLSTDEMETAIELAINAVNDHEAPNEAFRAGVAQGTMNAVVEASALEVLSWGPPLCSAVSLARIARPGEVLLDPKIVASRPGELLLLGVRVAIDGGKKVRGARIDTRQPWRKLAARSVVLMREPDLIGWENLEDELVIPLGCIGIVRADPGTGGTRLLDEAMRRLVPSRILLITPVGASREPLGAVRRALSRSAVLHGAPALPEGLRGALERLLAGEGTDRWSAAELIDTWLSPANGRFGVLAVDDASEIDPVSLEAIATALSVRGSFRALIRLGGEEPLPPALITAPIGAIITASPFDKQAAERIAEAFAGGALAPDAARRWAKRGGGFPLGIREALAEGLTTGELCFIGPTALPRRRSSGRGGAGTPRQWIERRIAYLSEGERAALMALAMLGGDASETMIDALAVGMGGPGAHSAVVVETLIAGGWVARPEPGWLKLTSRTSRDTLLTVLSDDTRKQWNMAAAGMLRHYSGMLGHADAAWYAAQAGDHTTAAELALDAARAAKTASLEDASDSLRDFAKSLNADSATAQAPDSFRRKLASSLFPPPPATNRYPFGSGGTTAALPDGDLSEFGEETFTGLPSSRDISDAFELAEQGSQRGGAQSSRSSSAFGAPSSSRAQSSRRDRPSLELDLEDMSPDSPRTLETAAPSVGPGVPPPPRVPVFTAGEASAQLAEQAKQALVQGDLPTLERLITKLRATGEYSDLVERMSGFVALGRGAKAEALRKLRNATELDQPPAQRARALLAYGVALAATGQAEAALIEALDALARAREASDRHGEEACARFLARLSSAAGFSSAAVTWANVVKSVSATPRG